MQSKEVCKKGRHYLHLVEDNMVCYECKREFVYKVELINEENKNVQLIDRVGLLIDKSSSKLKNKQYEENQKIKYKSRLRNANIEIKKLKSRIKELNSKIKQINPELKAVNSKNK